MVIDEQKLVISACNLDIIERSHSSGGLYQAMVDLGANVNLGPVRLARVLSLTVVPHIDGRKIGTADTEGHMVIVGWIFPCGFTGPIALVEKAAFILLSVIQLQKNGMGVHCPPERPICILTMMDNEDEVVFIEIYQSAPTNLYFVDINKLIDGYMPEYVPQVGDITGPDTVLGGDAGLLVLPIVAVGKVCQPLCSYSAFSRKRKRHLTMDIIFRVWNMHMSMNHVSLTTIAFMLKMGTLQNASCTEQEVLLVRDHQDCVACMLAKAKAITAVPSSGIRCNITGKSWSMDYQGPFRVAAIGGYTGRFLFIERSRGYQIVFLVRAKTEAFACVLKVDKHCKRYGHVFMELQVDFGSVELSADFQQKCHLINDDHRQRGIEVNPVNINMQQQNVVERYVQTHDNMFAAIMADSFTCHVLGSWNECNYRYNESCDELIM